jgi:SAM-dependent methyltransferase
VSGTDDRATFEERKRVQAIALGRDRELFNAATELLVADEYNYSYFCGWMGVPIIQMLVDIMATHREKAARRVVELLAIKSGDRVLDIGCGTADVGQYLPASVDYYGFDFSGDYAAAARRRRDTRNCFAVKALAYGAAEGLGRFRTPDEYIAIARRTFVDAKARVVDDLLSIPYTHCIVEEAMAAE